MGGKASTAAGGALTAGSQDTPGHIPPGGGDGGGGTGGIGLLRSASQGAGPGESHSHHHHHRHSHHASNTHHQDRTRTRSLSSMSGTGQITLPMLLSRAAAAAAAANGHSSGSSSGATGGVGDSGGGAGSHSSSADDLTASGRSGDLHSHHSFLAPPSTLYMPFNGFKCPICSKLVLPDDLECHLVICLTKPRITYNEDVLTEDKGECVICLEDMEQGDTISRLPCLCVYHKHCIDQWFQVNRSCPEHPAD